MSNIFVLDEFPPEATAMMAALYSRSAESVMVHAEKVRSIGSAKFMQSYYVGYGHKSIGDCGSTTIFIEGVSMLAAKAIEHSSLFNGQETSTRYIDMSKQRMEDPIGTPESGVILAKWMEFYTSNQEAVQNHLRLKYPRRPNEEEKIYEKAIKARAFDILRSFLPAGATTQLAWHTTLRHAADHLQSLQHHPDPLIRDLGKQVHAKIRERYPDSFGHEKFEPTETYHAEMWRRYSYFNPSDCPEDVVCKTDIDPQELAEYADAIRNRPFKTEMPKFLMDLGLVTFEFLLDFGSFRDLHRHRNGICRMPLLRTKFGFNKWYLEQLPDDLRAKAETLIAAQTAAIHALDATPEQRQYYIAMGFNVPCRVSYGLPATVYTIELRSGKLVHPTLRRIAHAMARALKEKLPSLVLHADMDLDDWDVRRGTNDIIKKETAVV